MGNDLKVAEDVSVSLDAVCLVSNEVGSAAARAEVEVERS